MGVHDPGTRLYGNAYTCMNITGCAGADVYNYLRCMGVTFIMIIN